MEHDVDKFIRLISKRDLCLQAGAAIGEYPGVLARYFKQVVAVEPNPENFSALPAVENVRYVHAALWNETGVCGITPFRPGNNLTGYVVPGAGDVPLITIDSLGLAPDLIYLDIEGSEYRALCGAAETLKHCKSVVVEQTNPAKGLERNVSSEWGDSTKLLASLGYRLSLQAGADQLWQRE